jgi:DNA end-binding protein Ku
LFPATSEREKISFHQLNKETGHRIKQRKVDAVTGQDVDSHNIIKGYEIGKDAYIEIDPEELKAIAVESKRIIEIEQHQAAAAGRPRCSSTVSNSSPEVSRTADLPV